MLCAIALAGAAHAQVYLHDSQRDKEAQTAKKKFAEATDKDAGVFPALLANIDAVHQRDLAAIEQLNRTTLKEYLNKMAVWTWGELYQDLRARQPKFLDAHKNAEARLDELHQQIAGAKSAEAGLDKKLAGLQTALDKKKKEYATARPTLKQFEDQIDHLKLASIQPDLHGLQTILGVDPALDELRKLLNEVTQKPPGLQLVMLDAGVQFQKLEIDRQQAELAHDEIQLRLETEQIRELQLISGAGHQEPNGDLKGPGFGAIFWLIRPAQGGPNHFCASQDELILTTIRKLADGAALEPNHKTTHPPCPDDPNIKPDLEYTQRLRNLINALEMAASINGYQTYLLEAAEMDRATEEQRQAVRISAINARGREVLISHGLEGLSQYYAGGWTADDTANLFRALQTIAQGVTAGRIQ